MALALEKQSTVRKLGKRRFLRGVLLTRLGQELSVLGGRRGDRHVERALSVLEQACDLLTSPQARFELTNAKIALANALYERRGDDRDANIERALALYKGAISALDPKINSEEWSLAQLNLGICYADRARGSKEKNLDCAIAAYDAALSVYDRSRHPEDWARTQMNRALALSDRHCGDRAAAQTEAIAGLRAALTVRTRRRSPQEWATCQSNLGALYFDRVGGDRAENLELAIAAFRNALKVRTRAEAPEEWASTMSNLALALSDRVRGRRDHNIEQALDALREVLKVRTKKKSPILWAKTQALIAVISYDRALGSRSANLERAIKAGQLALRVFEPQTTPSDWAHAQTVTANALGDRIKGDRSSNIEAGIALLNSVVETVRRDVAPVEWATAHLNLATAFLTRIKGGRAENLERSFFHSRNAMKVFTEAASPLDWASIQANLASTLYHRAFGDRATNLERSIQASERALTVFTAKNHPLDWAMAQINIANALRDRIVGKRSDNLERALAAVKSVLRVLDPDEAPTEWAAAHSVHASVLLQRTAGSPRRNIEAGIRSIRRAIEIYEKRSMPLDWAQAQGALASLYLNRRTAERSDNVEHAMVACRETLSVLRPDNDPMHWAEAKMDLAIACFERSRGDRSENLEQAIEALNAALTIFDRRNTPWQWARAQGNLANMYALREKGAAAENAAMAMEAGQRSLAVFTKLATPYEWAIGMMNAAIAMQQVETGRGGGLDASIKALENALTILNRKDHPLDWGMAKTNLGNALRWRARKSEGADLSRAITAIRDALKVFTRARFPEQHLRSVRMLGATYAAARKWRQADLAYHAARETAELMMGRGLHAGEQARVLQEVSQLGQQGALARVRCGDRLGALALLEKGRAVELALSLRLDAIRLPAQDARRLRELRRQARAVEAELQAARDRTAKALLARLEAIYAELNTLIGAAVAGEAEASAMGVEQLLRDVLAHGVSVIAPIVTDTESTALVARLEGQDLNITHCDLSLHAKAASRVATFAHPVAGAGPVRAVQFTAPVVEADAAERAWGLFGEVLTKTGVAKGSPVILLAPGNTASLTPALAARGGELLLNDYELSVSPSLVLARTAQSRAQRRHRASLGAVINPTLDLDGAVVEHAFVAKHFAPDRQAAVVGSAATVGEVVKAVRGKSYWLIAAHGRFDWTNAPASWLALANGQRLHMNDMLFSSRPRGLRLVVLSACESGLHEQRVRPEEFQGFARMFLQMGAAGVIVAAWPVDDTATAFLIGRFFKLHISEGQSAAAALRGAQLWLRDATAADLTAALGDAAPGANAEQERALTKCRRQLAAFGANATPYATPEYWAGFTLVGA